MCLARTRRCGPHRPTRHLICVGFPASTRGSRPGTRSAGFLVGDAAHVHSPIGGPGLNLGLQDAVNLGWKLAAVLSGRVEPTLLATYETERRPAAERVITQSRAQLALSSDRGLKSPRCANSSPNWSPTPQTSVASVTCYRVPKTVTSQAPMRIHW